MPEERDQQPTTQPPTGEGRRDPGGTSTGTPAPTTSPTTVVSGGNTALDRPAVERVLARAAELQSASMESGGQLTEAQLMEVGQEVGLSPQALRQALAEERTRVALPEGSSWSNETFGPAHASASRTISGTTARAMERLEHLLSQEEGLTVKRRFSDRTTWEPRRDMWTSLRRQLNPSGRGFALMSAHEVAATVVPVDQDRIFVRLDADLSTTRQTRLRLGWATAATGVVSGGALAVIGTMLVVPTAAAFAAVALVAGLPAVAGVGGGYAIARQFRGTAVRAQLALEQLLDRLEHDPPRASIPPLLERLLR